MQCPVSHAGRIVALGLVLAVGCSTRNRPVRPDASRTSAAAIILDDAADESADGILESEARAVPELPESLAGPLAACIARVNRNTPAELAGALETLEYGAVAEDACRIELATATRASTLCDGVALSALREACVTRVAMAAGRPDDCPRALGVRGRDPVCLAIATRSASLCAAALEPETSRCVAIAHADPNACSNIEASMRTRCRRDVLALAGALARIAGQPHTLGTAHLRLDFGPLPDGGAARTEDHEVPDFAHGVYLATDGTLYLVDPAYGWPGEFAVRPVDQRPVLGFALRPGHRAGPGSVDDFQIVLANGMVIRHVATSAASVQFAEVPHGRAGNVTGTLVADGAATAVPVRIELTFHTFVRDIVDRAALF